MLRHAFERWGCIRVEFKTSALNQRSRAAILRIGAREEGILRHHMINEDGSLRDSVFFSMLAEEWPEARRRLEGCWRRTACRSPSRREDVPPGLRLLRLQRRP